MTETPTSDDIETGDIVVYEREKTFPMNRTQAYEGVVKSVGGDQVDLGIDGTVPISDIVEVKGKSPSVESDSSHG